MDTASPASIIKLQPTSNTASKTTSKTTTAALVVSVCCGALGLVGVVIIAVLVVVYLAQARQKHSSDHSDHSDVSGWTQPRATQPRATQVQHGTLKRSASILSENTEAQRVVILKSESCGHCKALTPVIQALQKQGVNIESVDAPSTFANKWFAENGVVGFPTICEMKGDRVVDIFKGRRTAENIKAYVEQRLSSYS